MPAIVLRLRQKGYTRAAGFQAVQWAITVPTSDPISAPPLATTPATVDAFLLVRTEAGFESLERVCQPNEFALYPEAELVWFEPKGPAGNDLLSLAEVGDILTFPQAGSTLTYWLEDSAPYSTASFTVKQVRTRKSGTLPHVLSGNQLQLPGYVFSDDDVGRYVFLEGFLTSTYNGYAQILSFVGSTATISKTISATQTGSAWSFQVVEIDPGSDPNVEPRYFPTRERNLAWQLFRGSTAVASATSGGETRRAGEAELVRSVRFTSLLSSQSVAVDLFTVTRAQLQVLYDALAASNTAFSPLRTTTYGP